MNTISGDQERRDILELDALSDDALKYNFGYGDSGIENLREQIQKEQAEQSAD